MKDLRARLSEQRQVCPSTTLNGRSALSDIVEQLASEYLSAAHTLTDQIEEKLQTFSSYPFLGKLPSNAKLARMGYRGLVVGDYLAFYKVRRKTVLVYRNIHGARDILPLLNQL
ncbi:MAG: type II toxin-antitoxin system RelE/ParE family toxin [Nitrospiraceae bacterium]